METRNRLQIQIIVGTTRPGRFSVRPARWIYNQASARSALAPRLIDLRDYPLPFYDEPLPPKALAGRYTHPEAKEWAAVVGQGDAYIIVTAEYNHAYPAVLKNALDYPYFEWNRKPVAFVAYGTVSGARAVEQLRLVAIELQMAPLKQTVHIPPGLFREMRAVPDNDLSPLDVLNDQAAALLDELTLWAEALKSLRERARVAVTT